MTQSINPIDRRLAGCCDKLRKKNPIISASAPFALQVSKGERCAFSKLRVRVRRIIAR
jgi:hypothetical protein